MNVLELANDTWVVTGVTKAGAESQFTCTLSATSGDTDADVTTADIFALYLVD